MNDLELQLFNLVATENNKYGTVIAEEIRWELEQSDSQLLVWVSYLWVKEFIESLKEIFGESVFGDYGFEGIFQHDGICIDINEILDGYGIDLECVFPMEEYC